MDELDASRMAIVFFAADKKDLEKKIVLKSFMASVSKEVINNPKSKVRRIALIVPDEVNYDFVMNNIKECVAKGDLNDKADNKARKTDLPAEYKRQISTKAVDTKKSCDICCYTFDNNKFVTLKCKCKDNICIDCYAKLDTPKCPFCGQIFGKMIGNQPLNGSMKFSIVSLMIPGFNDCDSAIQITYDIPPGIQGKEHPNPGVAYYGANRIAYLPNNKEGQRALQLLKKAFDQRLIFTIGRSVTTGLDNCVTWNDIHHKTQINGQ